MKRRAAWGVAVALATLLGADQIAQYTVLRDGELLGVRIAPFDPPLFCELHRTRLDDVRAALAGDERVRTGYFDAELGWCPQPDARGALYQHDWSSSRIGHSALPRERSAGVARIVAVGCSFTRGDEVAGPESWAAQLDEQRADLELANLGMGGYGVDQALLRLRRDGLVLQPDAVWLGFVPATALRISTIFPPLLRHWSTSVAFKPRFYLAQGALEQVPSPARELADFARLMTDQRAFLAEAGRHDLWVGRAPLAYAPRGSSWTHAFASTRLALTALERRGRAIEPWYAERGEVYTLLRALIVELAREVEAAGADFRLVILPSREDLRSRARHGGAYWDELLDELREARIEVVDVSEALAGAGALEADRFWMPGQHYSPAANRVVAEHLARPDVTGAR